MADLSAKEAKALGNQLVGLFYWVANFILGLAAIIIIGTAFLSILGVRVPFKVLSNTELAYAMGAYYLYRKA